MALTEISQLLIDFLQTSKASEFEQFMAYRTVTTEEQQLALCRFLSANESATGETILEQAQKIAAK